jgi:hypothetical protein
MFESSKEAGSFYQSSDFGGNFRPRAGVRLKLERQDSRAPREYILTRALQPANSASQLKEAEKKLKS